MASSFEKSVKGATKIKVRWLRSYFLKCTVANVSSLACRAQIEICRTHPYSHTRWRARRRRSIPCITKPTERLNMDNSVQIPHHCSLYDSRRGAERYTEISGKWARAQTRCEQLY
jgi:hypothetical protein